jgi:hypothetical protein
MPLPWSTLLPVLLLLAGCMNRTDSATIPGRGPHPFVQFDQNVSHDTLLVQTSFMLGDSSHLMVASHVEDTFEGLRLYRYTFRPDSSVQLLAVSSPAYDSWTLLPTFFPVEHTTPQGQLWVMANMGEKESWGQKLMLLDSAFHDIGFLDMALPERVLEEDTMRLKRRSIAPHLRLDQQGDTAFWRFACDSVYLYDDQQGQQDRIVAAHRVMFISTSTGYTALQVDGSRRPMKTLP